MPATIVIDGSLVHLPTWCGQHFPTEGQMVKGTSTLYLSGSVLACMDGPGLEKVPLLLF